jgi:hypothetical protein
MTSSVFSKEDRAQLAERGYSPDDALEQLERIANPKAAVVLDRPCTVGDGIRRIDADEAVTLRARHEAAVAAGRYTAFVPASGAATRMFHELIAWRERQGELPLSELERALAQDSADALGVRGFLDGLPRFAFYESLAQALAAQGRSLDSLAASGPLRPLLDALLGPEGLDFARTPKGLIPFHKDKDHARSAFEEHWVEAADAMADGSGLCRVHATVAPEHETRFARAVEQLRARLEPKLGRRFDVALSVQGQGTDTLSLGADGQPFRDADGRLLFRPAGHGALLANLGALGADLAFLKNIDNVASDAHKAPTYEAFARLSGVLLDLEERLRDLHASLLSDPDDVVVRDAAAFAREVFGREAPHAVTGDPRALAAWLDRPIRVCGMVPNAGEPGGGPFWVRGLDGAVTLQIVEGSQVPREDAGQRALFAAATHFNPVFLVCSLRDASGNPHELARFVDQDAAIVTQKSFNGRELLALERPGLWNGGMAGWHTVFVEVPLVVFNPVKTVRDLLRPEHQG